VRASGGGGNSSEPGGPGGDAPSAQRLSWSRSRD
jgi:hypothetical protein